MFALTFLTVHEDADYSRAALYAGGLGYVVTRHDSPPTSCVPSGQRRPYANEVTKILQQTAFPEHKAPRIRKKSLDLC
jgi:hypothetical protein